MYTGHNGGLVLSHRAEACLLAARVRELLGLSGSGGRPEAAQSSLEDVRSLNPLQIHETISRGSLV